MDNNVEKQVKLKKNHKKRSWHLVRSVDRGIKQMACRLVGEKLERWHDLKL